MNSNALVSLVTMEGIKKDESGGGEAFNNPFQMMPSTRKMFEQISTTFLTVTNNHDKV